MSSARWKLMQGEALPALIGMSSESIDACITDPPYSSGGFSRDDKAKDPDTKYTQSGSQGRYPTFSGDSRDQRSYLAWCSLWIAECVRVLKPGGYFMAFTDWRQLPLMSDAVQAGGVFWRGLIAWDKGRGPHKGYFRHQCEYIVWGTKGAAVQLEHDGPFDGCIQAVVRRDDKHHLTGKPTALMRELVRPVLPGGTRPVRRQWHNRGRCNPVWSPIHRYRARGCLCRNLAHAPDRSRARVLGHR
ncbi:hypothetical protein LMG10661_01864 [Ralstonia syzygii subsp. syzygii]|nr:hypothetical protein LMG10661_01864 [Ralstonia syzygii subsp. syzygii]